MTPMRSSAVKYDQSSGRAAAVSVSGTRESCHATPATEATLSAASSHAAPVAYHGAEGTVNLRLKADDDPTGAVDPDDSGQPRSIEPAKKASTIASVRRNASISNTAASSAPSGARPAATSSPSAGFQSDTANTPPTISLAMAGRLGEA